MRTPTRLGTRYREARHQAILLAVVLWTIALVATFATSGYRTMTGRLKGGDFIQFYALGHLAFEDGYPRLTDVDRLHALQVKLLPASDQERYFPVYPPQTALIFAPLALMPYAVAAVIWSLILAGSYAGIVWYTWRTVRDALPDSIFVAASAAAFPPFWNLIQFGQTTVFALAGFFLGWLWLERRRPFLAGATFGLLAIKPQFGLVLAPLVLLRREWWILLGVISSIAVQAGAVIYFMGIDAVRAYAENVRGLRAIEPLLEPKPWQMHSVRTLTNLLPSTIGSLLWVTSSVAIVTIVIRGWRRPVPADVRVALLVLGSVLVSPHLIVYDATVLVLPILWIGTWIRRREVDVEGQFWSAVYLLFILFLLPTAWLIRVQCSVLVLLWIFWRTFSTLPAWSAHGDIEPDGVGVAP